MRNLSKSKSVVLLESDAGLCKHQPVHFELDLESDAELCQLQTVQVHFAELVSVCFTAMLCVRLGALYSTLKLVHQYCMKPYVLEWFMSISQIV